MINILDKLGRLLYRLECLISRAHLTKLQHSGEFIVVGRGVKIDHQECVSLGDRVHINDYCWLSIVYEKSESGQLMPHHRPKITIGSGTYIGRFSTLACINHLSIGCNVLISDRVFIGDSTHGFLTTEHPIKDQDLFSPGPVIIGDGSWIGIGVSILPNVKIGRNCVIGANSVVTKDIPDFCIAVGNPAKVIRFISPRI